MNNKYLIALSVIVALLVVGVGFLFFGGNGNLSASGLGPNHYQADNFLQGLFAGTAGQSKFSNTGVLTLGASGTGVTTYRCATSSWNPASVGSSTVATTSVPLTGSVLGDVVDNPSLTTSTQGLDLFGYVSSNATATVILSQPGGSAAAIDLATTTLKVCFRH